MTTGNLFEELSPEQGDAQVLLRASKGTLARAAKVVEHWQEMACGRRTDRDGDSINPLATRQHDRLWEAGDGWQVAAVVRESVRKDVALARMITTNIDVRRYVDWGILALADTVVETENARVT